MNYRAQHGDSPLSIARKFGVTPAALFAANPSKPLTRVAGVTTWRSLHIGESIVVPTTGRYADSYPGGDLAKGGGGGGHGGGGGGHGGGGGGGGHPHGGFPHGGFPHGGGHHGGRPHGHPFRRGFFNGGWWGWWPDYGWYTIEAPSTCGVNQHWDDLSNQCVCNDGYAATPAGDCVPVGMRDSFGLGQTSDADLLAAAQAVASMTDICVKNGTVLNFQNRWNGTSDSSMGPGSNIGVLSLDDEYGPDTSNAVAMALGGANVMAPGNHVSCPNWAQPSHGGGGGGGGGGYSDTVKAAAVSLDAQLGSQGCCGCGDTNSTLSKLTSAFKQAILSSAGDWGTPGATAAATVTGSTIDVSNQQCQMAFGHGTVSDLAAVLGAAMTYKGGPCATWIAPGGNCPCTDSGSNCGGTGPAPIPPHGCSTNSDCPGGQACVGGACHPVKPPSTGGGGGGGAGALLAGVLLVGGGVAATTFAMRRKRHSYA